MRAYGRYVRVLTRLPHIGVDIASNISSGKVLVSTQEHVDRLVAARLACDILGTGTIIVARTDAEAATLLDSNIDGRDHPFILGVTVPGVEALQDATDSAGSVTQNWAIRAKLMTFGEAVISKTRRTEPTSVF